MFASATLMNLFRLLLALPSLCLAQGTGSLDLDGRQVTIPPPVGMRSFMGLDAAVDFGARKAASISNNRLLDRFCLPSEAKQVKRGSPPERFDAIFDAQIDSRMEAFDLSSEKFELLVAKYREAFLPTAASTKVSEALAAGTEAKWKSLFGSDVELQTVCNGSVAVGEDALIYTAFTKISVDGGADLVCYVASAIVRLNNRLIVLNATDYTPNDHSDTLDSIKIWVKSVVSDNNKEK